MNIILFRAYEYIIYNNNIILYITSIYILLLKKIWKIFKDLISNYFNKVLSWAHSDTIVSILRISNSLLLTTITSRKVLQPPPLPSNLCVIDAYKITTTMGKETETKAKTETKQETFAGNKGLHDKEAYQLQLHEFYQPRTTTTTRLT